MSTFTGISLKFDESGTAKVVKAKEIMPHRLDLIERKMKANDFLGLEDMFFTSKVAHCRTALTRDHVIRENKLYETYLKLTEKIIDFPEINIDLSPEAA